MGMLGNHTRARLSKCRPKLGASFLKSWSWLSVKYGYFDGYQIFIMFFALNIKVLFKIHTYLLVRTILNQMLQFAPDQAKPVSVMTGDLERITIHHTSLISRRIFSHKLSPVRFSPCVTLAASGAGSSDLGPVPGPDWIWLINYMFTVYTPDPRRRDYQWKLTTTFSFPQTGTKLHLS